MSNQAINGAKRAEVFVRHVYGKPLLYPANEVAKIFADLAGVKSLGSREVGLMNRLGYEVYQVIDPVNPKIQKAVSQQERALRFVAEAFNSSQQHRDSWLHRQVLDALDGSAA